MRNFDFLKQIEALRDLYRFCNAAEEVQQTDYDSCGWNCRKALEWMVRAIYKLKHEPIGERDNLYTLSTGKPFTELIEDDDKLMMACHYIRIHRRLSEWRDQRGFHLQALRTSCPHRTSDGDDPARLISSSLTFGKRSLM